MIQVVEYLANLNRYEAHDLMETQAARVKGECVICGYKVETPNDFGACDFHIEWMTENRMIGEHAGYMGFGEPE